MSSLKSEKQKRFKMVAQKEKSRLRMEEESEVIEQKSELPTEEASQATEKKFQPPMEDETESTKATAPSTCFIVKIPEEEHFPSKAACLSHLFVIENIKKKLNIQQLEIFRNSCFGHFLVMPELKFSAQIVHHMLLRQCVTKKDNEMWFLVRSKGLRFSQDEFGLITGLSFGPIPQHNPSTLRIRDVYFNGENKVRNDQLEKVFLSFGEVKRKKKKQKQKKNLDKLKDDDMVKLALLYFLEHVLFGKEGKNLIDMEWVSLVDCLEVFNKYPWGRICYERTLCGLQRALENRVLKYQGKKQQKGNIAQEAYSLVGFPYAFQVWVYEAIPIIGMKYAHHVAKSCPRILNWSATSTPRFIELQQIFLDSNLSLCSLLKPTLEECQQEYYKYLNTSESLHDVPPEVLSQPTTPQDDTMGGENDKEDPAHPGVYVATAMENNKEDDYSIPSMKNLWIEFKKHKERCEYNFNYLKTEMKEINTKIDDLRQLLLDVKGKNQPSATQNTGWPKSATNGQDINMDYDSLNDKFESFMEDKDHENHSHMDVQTNKEIVVAEKHVLGMEKDEDMSFDPIIDIAKLFDTPSFSGNFSVYVLPKQLSPTIFKRRREVKKSYFLQPPFTDPTKKRKIKNEGETSLDFNPLQSISEEVRKSFHNWLSLQEGSTVDLNYLDADKEWFQSLVQRGAWLKDTHIDVAFYFFRKRRIEKPHIFSQKFTTTDTMFWQNVQARWEKHGKKWNQFQMQEDDVLISYGNGLYPMPSIKWSEVDIIYVPINIRSMHWVLGVVHLPQRRIFVYDSLIGINSDSRLKTAITPLARMLPRILHVIAYYGENGDPKGDQQWDIERLHDVPQQEYDGDCGMFLLKYAEYLMHDHAFSSLTGARMDWFREKMATELFYFKDLPM